MYDFDLEEYLENVQTENLERIRRKIMAIESQFSQHYFNIIFKLFKENIRPEKRIGFSARDGLNNVFNFSYHILNSKNHYALLQNHLELFLGFLHSLQHGKPSLVCDFEERYRYLIDEILIERRLKLHKKDFVTIRDTSIRLNLYRKRVVYREYEQNGLANEIFSFFDKTLEVKRLNVGFRSTINTLIADEARIFAKFCRGEIKEWKPRTVKIF